MIKRFLFFPALQSYSISGPSVINIICEDCVTIGDIELDPPEAPISWAQISGRVLTSSNSNTTSPTFCGLSTNALDLEPIVVRASITTPTTTLTKDVQINTTPQSAGSGTGAYSQDLNREMDSRKTENVSSGAPPPTFLQKAYQATDSYVTWDSPPNSLNWFSSTWMKLSSITGQYEAVNTFSSSVKPIVQLGSLPSWNKIRFTYSINGHLTYRDSNVMYFEDPLLQVIGDDNTQLSPAYSATNTNETNLPLFFSSAVISLEYEDETSPNGAYSKTNIGSPGVVPPLPLYASYIELQYIDNTSPNGAYSNAKVVKSNVAYTWSSGGIVIG